MRRNKIIGFILCLVLWAFLTFLCHQGMIVFDNASVGGAMLSGFISLSSILNVIRLVKIVYDGTYSALTSEND